MSSQNGTKAHAMIETPEVYRALSLLAETGQVIEVRALEASEQPNARYTETLAGYFDNELNLIQAISGIRQALGIYITLQPCHPDILHRAKNKLIRQKKDFSTPDKYITRYRWLLIDSDPERVSGISSTEEEHHQALTHSRMVRAALARLGWPDPVEADSGNGAHLLYRVDLETSESDLVRRVLEGLAHRFDEEHVHIDRTVFNPSRICKLYGTLACKGDNTPERPHRLSQVLVVPPQLAIVSREQLEAMVVPTVPAISPPSTKNEKHTTAKTRTFNLARWITEHNIDTYGAEPYQGGTRWVLKTCPWDASHTDRSAVILQLASGAIAARCQHDSCTGKKWEDLRVLYEPDAYQKKAKGARKKKVRDNEGGEEDEDAPSKESQALLLAELALEECELFRTATGDRYVRVPVDGHVEVWPVHEKSSNLKRWLVQRYHSEYNQIPNATAITSAMMLLESKAQFDQVNEHEVFLRLAEYQGKMYLDLANANRDVVEITDEGWQVISTPPVCFRRTKSMLPLPIPVKGGSLEEFRPFINVADEDWILLKSWLVGAFHPTGPYPVLALYGEHGTAKSTATRALRSLLDPAKAMLRPEPRDDQAFAIMAHNNYLVTLDNLSVMSGRLSDNLCKLATGAGDAYRTLYENDEESLFEACRPQIFNSIEELGTRGDLVDRSLSLQLAVIAEENRRDEKAYWAAYEAARPRVLGALLDAVALALRNLPHTKLEKLPRMADFALWAVAAEPAMTTIPGEFMQAYQHNKDESISNVLEESQLSQAVLTLMEKQQEWVGTATELETALKEIVGEEVARKKTWPQSPKAISNALKRLAPSLRTQHIQIRRDRLKTKRTITLSRQITNNQSLPEDVPAQVSTPDDDGNESVTIATPDEKRMVTVSTGSTGSGDESMTVVTQDLQHSNTVCDDLSPFLNQVGLELKRQGLTHLFWHVPKSGYANGSLSRDDYLARLEACLRSGDRSRIEAALENIEQRTKLSFEQKDALFSSHQERNKTYGST